MKPIRVHAHPPERTYKTAEAAIAGARNHPLQPQATSDAALLAESTLVDAFWTCSEHVLRFSNGRWLHVFLDDRRVRWSVSEAEPSIDGLIARVGSPPVVLDWGNEIGQKTMECSSLIAARRGKEFNRLWVNEGGVLVYLKGCLTLCFHPIFADDTGEDMLYVTEGY